MATPTQYTPVKGRFSSSIVKIVSGDPDSGDLNYEFTKIDEIRGHTYLNVPNVKGLWNFSPDLSWSTAERGYTEGNDVGIGLYPYFYWRHYNLKFTTSLTSTICTLKGPEQITFSSEEPIKLYLTNYPGADGDILDSYVKVRFDEPDTGNWAEGWENHNWGATGEDTGNWTYFHFRCSNSGENYDGPLTAYHESVFEAFVNTNGTVTIRGMYGKTTTAAIFTPGNRITVTITFYKHSASKFHIRDLHIQYKSYSGSFNSLGPSGTYPNYVYDAEENLNILSMTGQITGPCLGFAKDTVVDPPIAWLNSAEMTWAGLSCAAPNGLRYTKYGDYGRHGFVIDINNVNSFYMITDDTETELYVTCNADADEFIQSEYPDGTGYYSTYALKQTDNSIFGEGVLKAADLGMTFVTDRAEYNFTTGSDYYRLIGPKNLIYFGLSGQIDYYSYYKDTTQWTSGEDPDSYWKAETGMPYVADSDSVNIDEGSVELFDIFPITDRGTPNSLGFTKTVIDQLALFPMAIRLGEYHFASIELEENGSTYTRYLRLYKYNFSTDTISQVSSTSLPSHSRPATFSQSSCLMLYVAGHGSYDGRLYIGDPEYTGSKSNQGRIMYYDFTESSSTLTYNADLTQAIRNGYEGSCLGHCSYYDEILAGAEDSIIAYSYSGGSYGAGTTLSGNKGSLIGRAFSSGRQYIIAWDSDTNGPRMYLYQTPGFSQVASMSGYSYTCTTPILNKPALVSGSLLYPVLRTHNNGGYFITCYFGGATTISYSSSATLGTAIQDYSRLSATAGRAYAWYSNSLYYSDTPLYYGFGNLVLVRSDIIDTPEYPYSANMINLLMYDGSSEERIVQLYTSLNRLNQYYHLTEIGTSMQPHTEIGKWYIYGDFDLSTGLEILDTFLSIERPDSSCFVGFFYQLDHTGNYYTSNGVAGGRTSFGTIAAAKAAAYAVDYIDMCLTGLDISNNDTLTMYYVLEKTESFSNPLTSPGMIYLGLGLLDAGLEEPIICMHFNAAEIIKEVYKTTGEVLTVKCPGAPQAAGIDAVVSGTFHRVPF
jgi:hypothetical protein